MRPRLLFHRWGQGSSSGSEQHQETPTKTSGVPSIHVVLIKKILQMNRFEDSGGGSPLGDPPAPYGLHFTQWGLCYSPALEEGQAVVSGGSHRAAWVLSCHWTRYKKSFMGWCGANCCKPALFYFWTIFLVGLILWKKTVSGLVCLYRPLIWLLCAKLPESARK